MKIKIAELRDLMVKVLSSEYYSQEQVEKIAEVFLYAEVAGKNTQGILKLLGPDSAQHIQPTAQPTVIRKSDLSALVDGGGAAGPLAAQIAADTALEIAAEKGFAIVGVNNTFSSIGALSFYGRKLAQANFIGIVAASSPKSIIQHGGIDPLYGTNPIAFGFPTMKHPIVFDMASSAITWFGMVRAQTLGEELPPNVAIDADGNPTTDPETAMNGALLPFDHSYKGSGIAMAVELLAGVLPGASYVFSEGDWGTTFIAISPSLLMDTDEFKKRSSDLVQKVKASRTKSGEQIHVPGYDLEPEIQAKYEIGEIEIEDKIIAELRALLQT